MKETLLGLTTLTVLFGLAWFSASDSVSKIEIAESKEIKKYEEVNLQTENQSDLAKDPCDYTQEIVDQMTFSEAFKQCRECMGSEGTFTWKGELYTTNREDDNINIVEENNNLVEKEIADQSPTHPQTTLVESVVSK